MKPQLIVEQKITPFVNRYSVFGTVSNGEEKGELKAFAQQKRITFKEKITFYADATKQDVVFTLRAEKVLDVHGRYFIEDGQGARIGALKKEFGKSLLVSTWQILDADDQLVFRVMESSKALAIIRRFVGWVPYVGDIIDIAFALLLKYHFKIVDAKSDEEVGIYRKTTIVRDHYSLQLNDEAAKKDWRLFAALGVALDAFQSR